MTWRHIDNQAFQIARGYTLKLLGNNFMVITRNELGPHRTDKSQEALATSVYAVKLG